MNLHVEPLWCMPVIVGGSLSPRNSYKLRSYHLALYDRLVSVPTRRSLASTCITHLIKCGCKKTSCISHCSCRSQHLNCFEMRICDADEEVCSNVSQELSQIDDDDDDYDPDIHL